MVDRLNTDKFEQRKVCSVRLNGNKMQINAAVSDIESIKKIVQHFHNICSIYSVQISITDEMYNTRTGFAEKTLNRTVRDFYMADKISTVGEIKKENPNVKLSPAVTHEEDLNAPAIKTHSSSHDIVSLNKWSGKRDISTEETQSWKKLNKNSDIVIDTNLNQIFPEKTGKIPVALTELLQHVR